MKKFLLLTVFLLLALNTANATDDPMSDMANYMIPVYKDLYKCNPSSNFYLQVHGLENNKCHFQDSIYDCYVPMNVTQQYAKININWLTNKNRKKDNSSPEAKFAQSMIDNYCKSTFKF